MTDTCAFANDDLTVSLVLGLKKKKSETGNSQIFFCFGRAQQPCVARCLHLLRFQTLYTPSISIYALCVRVCCVRWRVYMVGGG